MDADGCCEKLTYATGRLTCLIDGWPPFLETLRVERIQAYVERVLCPERLAAWRFQQLATIAHPLIDSVEPVSQDEFRMVCQTAVQLGDGCLQRGCGGPGFRVIAHFEGHRVDANTWRGSGDGDAVSDRIGQLLQWGGIREVAEQDFAIPFSEVCSDRYR